MKNIKKIAILRANALGDFLVILPALQAIRKSFPDAEIVLLGKPWHQQFLVKGRTPVDRVIVVPVMPGIRDEPGVKQKPDEINAFFETIQKERFDIALHFQGNGISANPFLNKLNAKLTAGVACNDAEKLDRSIPFYYYQNEVMRYIEVASLIGANSCDKEPRLLVMDNDKKEVNALMSLMSKPFVVLHPAAKDIRRSWPFSNYVPIANWLLQKGFEVVITGSADDKKLVERIIAGVDGKVYNTCGSVTLGGLSAILKNAALVVAPDTGPLHLARAVGARTIGLYWAPNLINWGPLTRSNHRPLISWDLACPFCGEVPNNPYPFWPQNGCAHNISFVRNIQPGQVIDVMNDFLNEKKQLHKAAKICIEN